MTTPVSSSPTVADEEGASTVATATATLDPASLNVTPVVEHVLSVESSLPPHAPHPRHQIASFGHDDHRPAVHVMQLPRTSLNSRRRRRDVDVDMFLVAARTRRVVGAGLVLVQRRSETGDDIGPSDEDENDEKEEETIGGDLSPVTICCADASSSGADHHHGQDHDDGGQQQQQQDGQHEVHHGEEDGGHGHDGYDGEGGHVDDHDPDEEISCLSMLALDDGSGGTVNAPGGSSNQGGNDDGNGNDNDGDGSDLSTNHHVAIVLGTTLGRVLSTELAVHPVHGIRRVDVGGGGGRGEDDAEVDASQYDGGEGGEGEGEESEPFEPLPLDLDDDGGGDGGDGDNVVDNKERTRREERRTSREEPFRPEGGVIGIVPFRSSGCGGISWRSGAGKDLNLPPSSTSVWTTYGDGTCVKLPHFAFFRSVAASLSVSTGGGRRGRNSAVLVVRCCIPPQEQRQQNAGGRGGGGWQQQHGQGQYDGNIVPLPKSHPPLLAPPPPASSSSSPRPTSPLPTSDEGSTDDQTDERAQKEGAVDDDDVDEYDFCEAITFGTSSSLGDALCFRSTEDDLIRRGPQVGGGDGAGGRGTDARGGSSGADEGQQGGGGVPIGALTGTVIGGTKAIATGLFGAAMGAVSWGLGGGGGDDEEEGEGQRDGEDGAMVGGGPQQLHPSDEGDAPRDHPSEVEGTEPPPSSVSCAFYSRLHDRPPLDLLPGLTIYDPPRRVTSVTVDPDGNLAAAADTLGRVLLVDLATKQVLRVWKGVRDATAHWIQVPRPPRLRCYGRTTQLYLAIHARQRRVVEVWRVKHGPRVGLVAVGRDARLVPCVGPSNEGVLARCFILQPGPSEDAAHMMEALTVNDPEMMQEISSSRSAVSLSGQREEEHSPSSSHGTANTMQLQLLRQQLASETNVPSSPQAVYDTLTQIGSIADLSSALDLLATATHLEEGMGVDGSSFHSLAVAYCKKRLDGVVDDYSNNPHLKALASKITYHSQLISAFDVLHKYETAKHSDDDDYDMDYATTRTPWAMEAVSWIESYEVVTGRSIDADLPPGIQAPLKFATFAKSCTQEGDSSSHSSRGKIPDARQSIYLCDSKRDRSASLSHIFRPLLQDIFVFKVVNAIFDCLAIKNDYKTLQQYFGEWFMTLPAKPAARIGLFGVWCPMVRWLQEIVGNILDNVDSEHSILLEELHRFCSTSGDLPRAFLLASICREAVSVATQQKEAKTYGKISSAEEVIAWDELLRKIRVSLLLTLRLNGAPFGSFPVTVSNIDEGDIFSVFQWVARDELSISHKHYEIVALEDACRNSPHAFDPSSVDGDAPSRWELLQKACRAVAIKQERASKLFADSGGSLLLYLGGHNHPVTLAAHRALLLGEKWGQNAASLDLISDSVYALRSLEEGGEKYRPVAAAVRIDLWEKRIRPVYRALLFGFDDVPELSEDVVAPLCKDFNWLYELGKVALDVLALIARTPSVENGDAQSAKNEGITVQDILGTADEVEDSHKNLWPKVQEDVVLQGLVARTRAVELSSLEVHRAIVCAAKLTDDLSSLSHCVPSFSDVFLQGALSSKMPAPAICNEHQKEFLENVVTKKAQMAEGQIVDHFELEEIENLGSAWGVERKLLRAQFLLAMYDGGKDTMVNELANLSSLQLDFPLFVKGGLEISCTRLHAVILKLKRVKQFRSIVAMLDADTCQWVKQEAEEASKRKSEIGHGSDHEEEMPSLSSTHALILRILRMSSSIRDTEASEKAHSLSIMSGTLMKAVQDSDYDLAI